MTAWYLEDSDHYLDLQKHRLFLAISPHRSIKVCRVEDGDCGTGGDRYSLECEEVVVCRTLGSMDRELMMGAALSYLM